MAIIIIEGENKTGKSTLAKHLSETYEYIHHHCSQPEGDPYIEYLDILDMVKETGESYVLDRYCYGEFVYGPIYRGKSGLEIVQLLDIERILMTEFNSVLIHCHDTFENIEERFISENEESATVDKIEETLDRFEHIINLSSLIKFEHRMNSELDLFKDYAIDNIVEELLGMDKHQQQLKELQSQNAQNKSKDFCRGLH